MTKVLIDRAFLRTPGGLIHYRHAAPVDRTETPLVMAHGGPGSSAGLSPLIAELGVDRMVVAPDMMGNGDSDPPPFAPTSIGFYAECLIAVMDSLGVDRFDLYGHHTGAQVACEVAIMAPQRVRRIVLDGLGLFPPDIRTEYLLNYAPEIKPEADGAHLNWIWEFLTHSTQHFPHYMRDKQHRILGGAPLTPIALTQRAVEVIKAWSTYNLAYQAAFSHDLSGALQKVRAKTIILEVDGDPLARYAKDAAALLADSEVVFITNHQRAQAIYEFLKP